MKKDNFESAMKDIEEGKVVPLEKALNEEPPSEKVDKICKKIDEIYRENDALKLHNHVLIVGNDELDEENKRLKKEVKMLEKLIELNMKDLWDISDQRDWYYEEYQKLKHNEELKEAIWRRK
jgi:hypothetical protein